jgi:DNA-binding beta-propeller fold protein YncE
MGTGDGQFNFPSGIAVDAAGDVYVCDTENSRVQKFTPGGTFIAAWGEHGFGPGQFVGPWGGVVSPAGEIFVTDNGGGQRVVVLSPDGAFAREWGQSGQAGSAPGQFSAPTGITLDQSGRLYVADYGNARIQVFDTAGNFLGQWGSEGSADGQFNYPAGVAADKNGFIYVTDTHNHRVQKFTSAGVFVLKWGSYGSGQGQFDWPEGVCSDRYGNVYVTDFFNRRVQKFDGAGTFLSEWHVDAPQAIAIDANMNVYVVSQQGKPSVSKFTYPTPVPVLGTSWGRVKATYR